MGMNLSGDIDKLTFNCVSGRLLLCSIAHPREIIFREICLMGTQSLHTPRVYKQSYIKQINKELTASPTLQSFENFLYWIRFWYDVIRLYVGLLYKAALWSLLLHTREDIIPFHSVFFMTILRVILSVLSAKNVCASPGQWSIYAFISKYWAMSNWPHFPVSRNVFSSLLSENVFPGVLKLSKIYFPFSVFISW